MNKKETGALSVRTSVKVRFSEVDSLGMVWHGNYVQYLEDGREAFGHAFGLEYLNIYAQGLITPVADLQMRYLNPAKVDDRLVVETVYVPDRGAKLVYDYTIRRLADDTVILNARSIQLFQTVDGEFIVSKPDFIREWEAGHGIVYEKQAQYAGE